MNARSSLLAKTPRKRFGALIRAAALARVRARMAPIPLLEADFVLHEYSQRLEARRIAEAEGWLPPRRDYEMHSQICRDTSVKAAEWKGAAIRHRDREAELFNLLWDADRDAAKDWSLKHEILEKVSELRAEARALEASIPERKRR